MATASASDASKDSIVAVSPNSERTINWTWVFSARPYPTTLILTSSGEYSARPNPASPITSRATPLTCASFSADFAFAAWKTSSTAANSGLCSRINSRRPFAISNSRFSKGHRGLVLITPATTMRWLRPSLSITPYPVRSLPQSMPSTRTLLRHRLQLLLVDIEVGVYILHVVVLFQSVVHAQHAAGILAFQPDQILRHERDRRVFAGNAVGLQRLQHALVRVGRGEDLPAVAVAAQILRAGVQHDAHQLVFGSLIARHEDLALALEHPGDAALFTHVAAVLGEHVADFGDGTVAVVGRDVHQNRGPAGTVAFKHHLLDLSSFQFAGAAHDRFLDVVAGHGHSFRSKNRGAQTGIAVGIAAVTRGDGDFFNEAGECLPALGV